MTTRPVEQKLRVRYCPPTGNSFGNLLFDAPVHPMRYGKLPNSHPCHDNPKPMVFSLDEQPKSDDALGKFRALGYYASCFPEGDGICFASPEGKTDEQTIADVVACFGWEVRR